MDVLMPDGTLVTDVPEGITQSQLLARYSKFAASRPAREAPVNTALSPQEQAAEAAGPFSGIASILSRPSKPRPIVEPTLSPEEQVMGADDVSATINAGAEAPTPVSVLQKFKAEPVPADQMLNPGLVDSLQSKFDAMPEADRMQKLAEISQRSDAYGRAAKVISDRYLALNSVTSPALQNFDPRLEAQTKRFIDQGLSPENAVDYAKQSALSGKLLPSMAQITEAPPEYAEAEPYRIKGDKTGIEETGQTLLRGGVKAGLAYEQGVRGVNQFIGDTLGVDMSTNKNRLNSINQFTESMGQQSSKPINLIEGAITSIGQQLPSLIGGAITGSEPLVLSAMFAQSFGQTYDEGSRKGLDIGANASRAAMYAALEVLGEKFGLGDKIKGIKAAANGLPSDKIASFFARALVKEVPGEELTYAGQFAVDKGYGFNPEAGFADFISGAADTLAATVIQGGMMTGAGVAAGNISQKINSPEKIRANILSSAIDEGVKNTGVNKSALDDLVRQVMSPNFGIAKGTNIVTNAPKANIELPPGTTMERERKITQPPVEKVIEKTAEIENAPNVPAKLTAAPIIAADEESQDRQIMLDEAMAALGKTTVPPVTVDQPKAAEEPKIVSAYDMGENTEYRIVKTQSGYIANLYDKDSDQYVPGANRIFKTEVFGDDALQKAIDFAKSEQAKIVQPEGTPSVNEAPQAKQAETQEQQAPAASVTLYRGVPQGQEQRPTVGGAKFMSPDRKVAEMYAGPDGSVSEEVYSFKNPLQAQTWADAKSNLGLPQSATMEDLIDVARKAGHDGVTFNTTNGPEYIVIGKKAPAGNAAPAAPVVTPATVTPAIEAAPVNIPAVVEETAEQTKLPGRAVLEVPLSKLTLSDDVPQFKADANKAGVVEPLGGTFERTGVAPIQVWRRTDGRMEVISGRHRFDLAKRSGETTIPAQVHDEASGFTRDMAAVLDAELNIRDGQGKVKDYVNYFKGTGLDQKTADSRGLLARAPGKRAFTIATQGSDELVAGVRSDQIGDEAAYLIALNAPNDGRLQSVGIKSIQEGKSAANAINLMQAVKAIAGETDTTTDMFGFDDSAMKEAEEMAKIAAAKQREMATRLSAISGASKNPAVARSEGIDIRDPEAIKRRIGELRQLKVAWDSWSTNPNLVAEIRAERGTPVPELRPRNVEGEIPVAIEEEIDQLFGSIEEAENIVADNLTPEEQNDELKKATDEQAEGGGAVEGTQSEGADLFVEPREEPELTETTPEGLRAEEERRKKIEAEEAKAKKAAEDKAKADEEVGGFTLTGSNRPADVAAAQGQKDIFAQEEEKPAAEEGIKVVPFEAESSVVGDLLSETREEENPFDTRFNALMHPKGKPAKPKPTTFVTIDEAKAQLEEWRAEARRQGKTGMNNNKTIMSLFDASGEWSKPWAEAGYNVWTFDIQDGQDINDFSAEFLLNEGFGDTDVWGILAAPPCTDFSSSGAQYWAKKDASGQTEISNELVRQTLRTVEFLQPKIWALENPIGRIAKLNNLPPAHLSFDPNFYGDPYTKRTLLWGNFENNLPMAPVEATEGSRIINLSGKDKYARSLTPEGFAYAFFMANNAESMTPAERLSRTYYGVDPTAFEGATKEDEKAIKESDDPAFEDNYYDGELETAADIARSIISKKPVQAAPAAPIDVAKPEPVKTPEGGALRYPMASVLFNDGYQVLPLASPRTYVDKGGEAHRTFEKDGVRISLTPQLVLFQNKNAVLTGQGESTDLVINALLVDQDRRGKGAANEALTNLTEAANQYGVTLYIEPVPIVNLQEKNVGLDRQQLEDLYKKFGFDFAEDSNKVMVREPEVQKAGNEEVLGPVEKPAAPRLTNEPYTIEANFTEVGEEKQHLLLSNQSSKLTESQNQTLEAQYGAKRDTSEFLDGLRKDVIAFITQGAKAVNGRIRAIIKQVANGVLSVAIVFNPQYVSKPYTIAVPQYDISTSEVVKDLPKEAKTMSDAAKRAYGVIYPALEAQLKANDKLFIVADKQSGNTYMFNPDGSLLLQSKTLFGKAIGDYMHGDNEIVANRITPAGVFDLGLRDAKRSAGEAYTAGDYDFGKVFVLDKSHMGKNGPYSNTIMHSVWTNETDAKQRLAALDKPGAEDSRYSFGCINVNKETFKYLITNYLNQMDGAKIFIVPENGTNVMDFINGKAMNSDDIIRQRVEPVTKTTVTEKKVPAPKQEVGRKLVGREEEAKVEVKTEETKEKKREDKTFYSIEPTGAKPKLSVDVPNENWLQGKVDYAIEKGRNRYGIPHMSTVTGRFNKPVEVSLRVLSKLKGESNEQDNVRQESLDYIRKNWDEVSKEPPYIEVAYNGEAYVSEGNHRIMVALEKGLETMPVEIRYFDGGERKNGPLNPGRIPSLDEAYNSVGRTRETEEGQVQRSASLKRDLKTLNRMRKDGRITDEQFVERADAAILADEQQRLKEEPSERKRGFLHIQTRLNKAVEDKELSREARDLATWFMVNNEDLVSDLGVSIIGKGKAGQGGQYSSFNRIMTVIKNGGSDLTTVHEILHHLERMMPPKIQQAIRKAWASQLVKAQKEAKTPAEKLYFAALMEAHYGENSAENIEIPKGAQSLYEGIKTSFKIQEKKFSSENLANELLVSSSLPIENYEYFNPSEFWAVNGSDIVKARFDSVKGGTLARLKNWLKELGQKIKSIFGLKSDASIIRALDSLAKSDGKFVTDEMLGKGDYQAVIKNYKGNAAPTALWSDPAPSFMDGITYQLADKQIDTKRVIEEINKTVGQIDERLDAYTKESQYSSKSAAQIEDFLEDKFEPLFKRMKDDGVAHTELEKYLHNRHAEERNEQINKINLSPDVQDIGSGISTADARKYLSGLPAAEKAKLDSLAAMVDDIIEGTQKLLVDGGLETQETIDTWNKTYKHYIPLQRDDLDFVHTGSGYSGGVATKGSASKRAVGSIKPVKDILANIAIQREKAIRRSEQAHVGRALYGLAITNPNPGFWLPINPNAIKNKAKLIQEMVSLGLTIQDAENLIQEPKVPVIDKTTGLVKYQVNPSMRNSENVFPVRINGEDRFIIFNPKDERAMRMARSLKNLDADELGWFLGNMGAVTRWIASINTQYNPVFGVWNMARDVQSAALNLSTTEIAGKEKEVLKGTLPAMFAIWNDLRGKPAKNAEQQQLMDAFNQMRLAGGTTGFAKQFSGQTESFGNFVSRMKTGKPKEKVNIVEQELKKLNQGNARKAAQSVFNWLSDYNDAMENAVRLSAFRVALAQGYSEQKAASIAKELTVNFNRKGASSPTLQALYAFFNASVQGTVRLGKTLKGPAGRKIIAGGITLGVIQALALALNGYDDGDPPDFLKDKNFIIPIPFAGENYIILPMPMGFNIFPGIGRILTETVLIQTGLLKSNKDIGDKALGVGALILDAFNPLGAGSLTQMLVPTALDPIFAIAQNKSAFGRPIYKEDKDSQPTPGYQRSRDTATAISQGLAEFLNYVSSPSGTEFTKGRVSPTADEIDYLAGQYFGGVAREFIKGAEYIKSKFTEEDIPTYRIPIVGKLYGETQSPAAVSSKFYDNVTQMAKYENEIKKRQENKLPIDEYMENNPESILWKRANRVENEVSRLNKTRHKYLEDDDMENVKRIDEMKNEKMKRFNDAVKEAQ